MSWFSVIDIFASVRRVETRTLGFSGSLLDRGARALRKVITENWALLTRQDWKGMTRGDR